MASRLILGGALAFSLADGQPSCDQTDGDYPGCGISKMTHSSSKPIDGKTWIEKYFNVQTPGDECTDDVCDCDATSDHEAWQISQGRTFTTREISPSGGASAGNGFGLHLVDVPAHLTTGGLTTEEVEAHFTAKLGDMSKFDSFMDYNVVFATSALQSYKSTFQSDGVKYLAGTWTDGNGKEYSSIIVQVPQSQLIFELVQQTSLTYSDGEMEPIRLEQRVPDSALAAHEQRLTTEAPVADTKSSYIVSLAVNRAISADAMAKIEEFYVSGMGTTKTHDASANDVSKKCFLWPGATVNICFTNRPDSATSSDFKVSDFESMLNTVHDNIIGGHPFCPMDKWFDNHYAIDSQSVDNSKILSYVNSKNTYHICSSGSSGMGGTSAIFDPTGLGIQMDTGLGLADDCESSEFTSKESHWLQGGKYNPACTVDTSQCASTQMIV